MESFSGKLGVDADEAFVGQCAAGDDHLWCAADSAVGLEDKGLVVLGSEEHSAGNGVSVGAPILCVACCDDCEQGNQSD